MLSVSSTLQSDDNCDQGEIYHGGNLSAARRQYPTAPTPWLDLSTGINAVPFRIANVLDETWKRLPEASALKRLQEAAAKAYGSRSPRQIVPAAGTQALIQWMPWLFPARRVAILGFGYQEHPSVWRTAGAEVTIVEDLQSLVSPGIDVAIVVNPNNPDGRVVRPDLLRDLTATLNRRGGIVIIDEAFMDVMSPSASFIPLLPENGAIVLRSFGKAYGLAGVRLGFAVAGERTANRLRDAIGPWAVSGPAIEIGIAALSDKAWLEEATARLVSDAKRMDEMLGASGFTILGGTPLFRLVQHSKCDEWFKVLAQNGILVRPFPERPNWLRFGIPGQESDWTRLQNALQSNTATRHNLEGLNRLVGRGRRRDEMKEAPSDAAPSSAG